MSAQRSLNTFAPSFGFQFTSSDVMRIGCARWDSSLLVRGVVQIAHGIGEHNGRYAETIEFLIANGLTVYGNDHRGHGRTAVHGAQFGDFGRGGFDLLVEDMICLSRLSTRENPNLPLILLGHSMGSLAAQQYALEHSSDIDPLILSRSRALDAVPQI